MHGGFRRRRFPLESREDREGVGVGVVAALVSREVDVGQIDEGRLAPALGVRFEVFPKYDLVDRRAANTGADDGLDAIDQAAADDRVASLHAELDGAGVQRFIRFLRLRIEEAHVLDQALVDHRVDLGQSDGKGLIEPERVFDRLAFERSGLLGIRGPPDLEGESLDPLVDLAARNLDRAQSGLARETRLQREEQRAQRQEMKQRCTQQKRPFEWEREAIVTR